MWPSWCTSWASPCPLWCSRSWALSLSCVDAHSSCCSFPSVQPLAQLGAGWNWKSCWIAGSPYGAALKARLDGAWTNLAAPLCVSSRTRNGQESSKARGAILLKEMQVTWNKQFSQECFKLTGYGCLDVHTCFLQNLPKIACFFKQGQLLEIRHYWIAWGGRQKYFK